MGKHKHSTMFYCFSPAVMLATFFIEITLVMYLLIFRRMSHILRLSIALLVCLAIFQLSEYGICEYWGFSGDTWARIGFTAITLLPPLGLHLVLSISNHKTKILYVCYALAAIWIGVFLTGSILEGSVCHGNYVIFAIPDPYEGLYYLYYDSILLGTIALAFAYAKREKKKSIRQALRLLAFGYLAFIIPSIIFTLVDDYSGHDSPLPSIMCGFAVLLALLLALKVVPLTTKRR